MLPSRSCSMPSAPRNPVAMIRLAVALERDLDDVAVEELADQQPAVVVGLADPS